MVPLRVCRNPMILCSLVGISARMNTHAPIRAENDHDRYCFVNIEPDILGLQHGIPPLFGEWFCSTVSPYQKGGARLQYALGALCPTPVPSFVQSTTLHVRLRSRARTCVTVTSLSRGRRKIG